MQSTQRPDMAMPVHHLGIILMSGSLFLIYGCSTPSPTAPNADTVRQHADAAFQRLHAQEQPQTQSETSADTPTARAQPSSASVQIPAAEIRPSDDRYVMATGYGTLSKGLYLCQHTADLAARVELSKLIRVQVKERSVDRVRERTGKDADQDIEVVREGLVNEVLTDVKIVDRKVDQAAGTCSSTAVMPKSHLSPQPRSEADSSSSALK